MDAEELLKRHSKLILEAANALWAVAEGKPVGPRPPKDISADLHRLRRKIDLKLGEGSKPASAE